MSDDDVSVEELKNVYNISSDEPLTRNYAEYKARLNIMQTNIDEINAKRIVDDGMGIFLLKSLGATFLDPSLIAAGVGTAKLAANIVNLLANPNLTKTAINASLAVKRARKITAATSAIIEGSANVGIDALVNEGLDFESAAYSFAIGGVLGGGLGYALYKPKNTSATLDDFIEATHTDTNTPTLNNDGVSEVVSSDVNMYIKSSAAKSSKSKGYTYDTVDELSSKNPKHKTSRV